MSYQLRALSSMASQPFCDLSAVSYGLFWLPSFLASWLHSFVAFILETISYEL